MSGVTLPRSRRQRIKAAPNVLELARWANDTDLTIGEMLEALGKLARATNLVTNQGTEQATGLAAHASTHLPAGTDPLATGVPGTIQPDAAAAEGTANAFARSDHTHAIVAAVAAALGSANAEGTSTSFARADHVHIFPTTLQSSANATTAVLTDDGTDQTLTLSTGDFNVVDSNASTALTLYADGGADAGLHNRLHMLVGGGSAALSRTVPDTTKILTISEDSDNVAWRTALDVAPTLQDDLAGTDAYGALYGIVLLNGFDPDAGGFLGSPDLYGHSVQIAGTLSGAALTGAVDDFTGVHVLLNVQTPTSSPAWDTMRGLYIQTLTVAGGTVPTTSFGIDVATAGNGTTSWAGRFAGDICVTATNKIGLGKFNISSATKFTNSLRAKTGTGSILVMELNAADEYEFSTAGVYPATNGANTLGIDGNGWGSLILKDTAAAFETTIQATSTSIAADNALTLDLGNASRTITLSGNPTMGDYFDQAVKTTSDVTFNTVEIDGSINHDGAALGFFGAPPALQTSAYTITNGVADRSYDADATSTAELADVLYTLITDLQTYGLLQ